MKKLSILLIMMFCVNSYSQISISTGIDIRNSIAGSSPTLNNPELNCILQYQMQSKITEITVGLELFNSIGFKRYFFGIGLIIPYDEKVSLGLRIEPGIIERCNSKYNPNWGGKSSHLSIGLSGVIKYKITDKISLGFQSSLLKRTDLEYMYNDSKKVVLSNYIIAYYKIL